MRKIKPILAIIVVAVMISGAFFIFGNSQQMNNFGTSDRSVNTQLHPVTNDMSTNTASQLLSSAKSSKLTGAYEAIQNAIEQKVPMKYLFVPNLHPASKVVNNAITLGYITSPAPMGIGFYNLYNVSGKTLTKNSTTSSFEASINISNLETTNLADLAPNTVTFQLNAILNNVEILNKTGYVFWTQNVVDYSARTHQLTFVDNIWNFSSSSAVVEPGTFYYSSTPSVSSTTLINIGPTVYASPHLVLNLYLNTSLCYGRQTVFFNYSYVVGGVMHSGNYETAIFNNFVNQSSSISYKAAPLTYFVSGNTLTPVGIPYDAEIMIGGPGGGSTATVFGINGTFNLKYYNMTTKGYMNVPEAYDIGSETGETSTGVNVHYEGNTAYLQTGPSMVYGLWNSTENMTEKYTISVSNDNGFVFVSPNEKILNETFLSLYLWDYIPILHNKISFYLPNSTYYVEALDNYYDPISAELNYTTMSLALNYVKNVSMGVYTPIYAFNNSQLGSIAISGSGTLSSPYVINACSININPIFGQFNDYLFPIFTGVFLNGTSMHVKIANFSMPVCYQGYYNLDIAFLDQNFGLQLPTFNGLNFWIYNSSNVIVDNARAFSWYSSNQAGYVEGTLTEWNSSRINIMNSEFISFGNSIFLENPANQRGYVNITNVTFIDAAFVMNVSLLNPIFNSFYNGPNLEGLFMCSGYDNISYSHFLTQIPVCDPNSTYMGNSFFSDYFWNYEGSGSYNDYGTMATTAKNIMEMPGFNFTLSTPENIQNEVYVSYLGLEIKYEGSGNYFDLPIINTTSSAMYYFTLLVNDQGYQQCSVSMINTTSLKSGDTYFAQPFTSNLEFMEKGLKSGTMWSVEVNGVDLQSSTSSVCETVVNGYYTYVGMNVPGYSGMNMGTVTLNESKVVVLTYMKEYNLTFMEKGLPSGTKWSVTLNGMTMYSTTSMIMFTNLTAGNYTYTAMGMKGY
ncbi:thermopsin family protease, partial [Caldiplasma sukawensis]